MRHFLFLIVWLFTSPALARLPAASDVNAATDSAILALDNSLENYYGNRDSVDALVSVRQRLVKVQELGVATRLPPALKMDDVTLKRALDEKATDIAFISPKVKECSYVVMTVLALSQGKCVRRPEFDPPPAITIGLPKESGSR